MREYKSVKTQPDNIETVANDKHKKIGAYVLSCHLRIF
jgi:hypothetical protein